MVKAVTRTNREAVDESHQIRKDLAPRVQDHVQDPTLEVVRGVARVHVPLLVRDLVRDLIHDHNHAPNLDLYLDLDPGAFQDREVARHLVQDQVQPKVDHDQGRVREKVVRALDPIAVRGRAVRRQDQDRVRERAVLDRGQSAVQGKSGLSLGLGQDRDLEVVRVQVQRNANLPEVRVARDLNPSPSRDPSRDQEAAAGRDHVPDRKAAPEAGVRADRHGIYFSPLIAILMITYKYLTFCER